MQVQSLHLVFVFVLFVKLVENLVAQVEAVLNLDPSLAEQEKPLLVDRYIDRFLNFKFQRLDAVDRKQPASYLSEVDLVNFNFDALENILRLDNRFRIIEHFLFVVIFESYKLRGLWDGYADVGRIVSRDDRKLNFRAVLHVEVSQSLARLKNFPFEDELQLAWRQLHFALRVGHDRLDGVLRLDLELQKQAEVRLNENMHSLLVLHLCTGLQD